MKLLTYLNTSSNVRKIQYNRLFKKSVIYRQMLWIQMRNCWQLGIYFTHPTVWLTAAEICKETHVFPKLYLRTNHNRLVQDMQIIMLPNY